MARIIKISLSSWVKIAIFFFFICLDVFNTPSVASWLRGV